MATFRDINYRIRSELSELSEITFSDEELFLYVVEGARIVHGMIATINPSFLLSGKKTYDKLTDYGPYEGMQWYKDYVRARELLLENGVDPYYVLPEYYQYLDVLNDGDINDDDYDAITAMDVFSGETNTLFEWLKLNNKVDDIDFSQLTIPTDCMFIYSMYVPVGTQMYKLSPTNLDRIMFFQDGDVPSMFCRTGSYVNIAPNPRKPIGIKMFYVPTYTAPTTETQDFNIPDMFMNFAVEYAILRAHNRNDRKTLVEQVFLNQKGELIQNILQKEEIYLQVIPTLTNYPYTNFR